MMTILKTLRTARMTNDDEDDDEEADDEQARAALST